MIGTLDRLNAALNGLIYTLAPTGSGTVSLNAFFRNSAGAIARAATVLTVGAGSIPPAVHRAAK